MITNMKLFGGDPKGLYDLDQACAARTSTPCRAPWPA